MNFSGQTCETSPQYIDNAECFSDQTVEFIEHRTISIGLKIRLAALYRAGQNPSTHKLFKFPLHSP